LVKGDARKVMSRVRTVTARINKFQVRVRAGRFRVWTVELRTVGGRATRVHGALQLLTKRYG